MILDHYLDEQADYREAMALDREVCWMTDLNSLSEMVRCWGKPAIERALKEIDETSLTVSTGFGTQPTFDSDDEF